MLESIPYQQQFAVPILRWIIFLPLLGALSLLAINKERKAFIRGFAFAVAILDFLFALMMLAAFRSGTAAMQFVEKAPWIESIGVSFHLGVDGISLWLVLLTTLLGAVAILSTWNAVQDRVKEFMFCMLVLQMGILGVFMSLDIFLFYLFWEIMLVPMYFLIGVWGGENRLYASIKFFLYTLIGSLVMILGFLLVYFNYHEFALANNLTPLYSFSLLDWYKVPLALDKQIWVFWALFVGFAIKVPLVPFHTWLPDAHTEAPTAGSVILAGLLLKMGTYGFVRCSIPLLPQASRQFMPILIALALIGIIYGGIVAMAQDDMKKLVAYSSVAHLGLVILGLFTLNREGLQGGILQMINHGLSTGALFLLVGLLYERRHTRMIADFGGLSKQLPVFAFFYTVVALSSMGFPGLNGFVGEVFILSGAFKVSGVYAAVAVAGVLVGIFYTLWLYQRVMLGPITNPANRELTDLTFREKATLVPLLVVMLWIGIYPKPFLRLIEPSVQNLLEHINKPVATATVLPLRQLAGNVGTGLVPARK